MFTTACLYSIAGLLPDTSMTEKYLANELFPTVVSKSQVIFNVSFASHEAAKLLTASYVISLGTVIILTGSLEFEDTSLDPPPPPELLNTDLPINKVPSVELTVTTGAPIRLVYKFKYPALRARGSL